MFEMRTRQFQGRKCGRPTKLSCLAEVVLTFKYESIIAVQKIDPWRIVLHEEYPCSHYLCKPRCEADFKKLIQNAKGSR